MLAFDLAQNACRADLSKRHASSAHSSCTFDEFEISLDKAAVIGGRGQVERFATSDEFAAIFMFGLDPAGRKAALDIEAIMARTSVR